jgi:hypothetical protein
MGNILVADMRHYIGEELPPDVARLREHLGAIVEAVTLRIETEIDYVTQIRCRRRPGHRRCDGEIIAFYDETEPSAIKWFCPFCGDGGYIRGWQGTAWDRSING